MSSETDDTCSGCATDAATLPAQGDYGYVHSRTPTTQEVGVVTDLGDAISVFADLFTEIITQDIPAAVNEG